jgi:retinol dehydrogenase 12
MKKTALITGSTNGIGKVTAMAIAKSDYHLIMVNRNEQLAKGVKQEIIEATGNSDIDLITADFAVLEDVRKAAKEIKYKNIKLDLLVNNAGFIAGERSITKDGFESMLQVNHLAPFLLTNLLLHSKSMAGESRIVNVSSMAHKGVKAIDWDSLNSEKKFDSFPKYSLTKLFNILFTCELAARLKSTKITVNCLHPGVISTNFGKDASGIMKFFFGTLGFLLKSPEQGAATSIHLALSDEVKNVSGEYYAKKKIANPTKLAQDEDQGRRLWQESKKMCGIDFEI